MMDDVKEADDKKRQYRNVDPLQDLNLCSGSGRVLYSRLCSGSGSGSILSTLQRIGIVLLLDFVVADQAGIADYFTWYCLNVTRATMVV